MSRKPVYMAGQGFMSDELTARRPPLWWLRWLLPVFGLLGLWLFIRSSAPDLHTIRVDSEPAGAEILLDLRSTGQRTPAEIKVDVSATHLLQVRLPGYQSEPLSQRLTASQAPERVLFRLRPEEVGGTVVAVTDSIRTGTAQTATVPPPQVGLAPLLTGALRVPSGVRERPNEVLLLSFSRWDPAFRLKVDGRVLPVGAARQLPVGSHRIQLDLGGRPFLDTLLSGTGSCVLDPPPRERFVEVRIQPAEAEIISGDRLLGTGRCLVYRGDLPLTLRFPPLAGLLPPAPLVLEPGAPASVTLQHRDSQVMGWSGGREEGLRLTGLGYVLPGKAFTEDRERGARLESGALLLGRAFHDRRPGGSQAARFQFDLPREANSDWTATLELSAGDSGHRYPLTLTRGALLSVRLNGTVLARDLKLEPGEQTRSWPVANLLRAGSNEVLIQSGEDSRSAARLFRLSVKVGP